LPPILYHDSRPNPQVECRLFKASLLNAKAWGKALHLRRQSVWPISGMRLRTNWGCKRRRGRLEHG